MCIRKSTKDFIEKSKQVHGEKYDYSKVEYVNNKSKVCIICPEHGEFWQVAGKHCNAKRGCPVCSNRNRGARLSKEDVLERFRNMHGSFYEYPKFDYDKSEQEIEIICPKHGNFTQTIAAHITGKGCRKCGVEKSANARTKNSTEWFVEEAKTVHGDKYDYSKSEYTGVNEKATIICPLHGEFEQAVYAHLKGHGCKECAYLNNRHVGGYGDKEQYFKDNPDVANCPCDLYLVEFEYEGEPHIKIGITTMGIPARLSNIKRKVGGEVRLIDSYRDTTINCYLLEQMYIKENDENLCTPHKRFKGWTESFTGLSNESAKQIFDNLVQRRI